jgi:hypothetical protein
LQLQRIIVKKLATLAVLVAVCATSSAFAQTNVGVSIGINQPGIYGRIDIGNYPQPVVINPQPVIIVQAPVVVHRQPIYLYVPPGHQKNWGKHCARYNACGQPVYFVQEQWVRDRYQQEHPGWRGDRRDGRGDRGGRGEHGRDRDGDHGKGHGRGRD